MLNEVGCVLFSCWMHDMVCNIMKTIVDIIMFSLKQYYLHVFSNVSL